MNAEGLSQFEPEGPEKFFGQDHPMDDDQWIGN